MPVDTDTLTSWVVRLDAPPTVKAVAVVESPPVPPMNPKPPKRSFVVVHPRYRQWLAKCGLVSPESFLAVVGEVVCGHPDRHVARVELHAGVKPRVAFLKREHLVGRRTRLRNWRAGFGWVSRCEREAITLRRLEEAGLPGPQWVAYGEHDGQAFLLVEELAGATELRAHLDEFRLTESDRRALAGRIGRALAELHEAGFGTPELAAKHLFLRPDVLALSLIDWQSAPKPGPVHVADRARWLGQLDATLAEDLASPDDRLRVLGAYRRTVIELRGHSHGVPKLSALAKECRHQAGRVRNRSSVAAQRQPLSTDAPQRLVWLAGEAVVVTPDIASVWPKPVIREPFYPATPTPTPPGGHREWVNFPDGRRAVLVRFHTVARVGRLLAALRERPWRSPGATAARVLFRLQRHGIPAPALLAFGQRTVSKSAAESFVVAEPPADAVPVEYRLTDPSLPLDERRVLLRECGRLLRLLHDAGCRPNPERTAHDPLFMVTAGAASVSVGSPFAVRLSKRFGDGAKLADLRDFVEGFPDPDRLRVLRGFLGSAWADRATRRGWARKVVS